MSLRFPPAPPEAWAPELEAGVWRAAPSGVAPGLVDDELVGVGDIVLAFDVDAVADRAPTARE